MRDFQRHRFFNYPRIRGVHMNPILHRDGQEGSSPHTRGTLLLLFNLFGFRRIIPAYAGYTNKYERMCMYGRDHSRIRGVHLSFDYDQ